MPFTFEPLDIPDVIHVSPKIFTDERGSFSEVFKASDFAAQGISESFVQVNQSTSKQGVLRGLHYQKNPEAQGKLVSVSKGEIFDVAVDIRQGSPTYGKWVSATLSSEKKNMLFIPVGFAHGFYVLSEEADVVYYCTKEYAPSLEGGIVWNDPALTITWPTTDPILSPKDMVYPAFADSTYDF